MKQFFLLCLASALTHAAPVRYVQVTRHLQNLASMDLSACQASYRFLNDNWMDCSFTVPSPSRSRLAQLTAAQYPQIEMAFPTADPDVEIFLRLLPQNNYANASLGDARFVFTAYYRRHSQPGRIATLPTESYAAGALTAHLKGFLAITDRRQQIRSRPMIVQEAGRNAYVYDTNAGGVVKVGRQTARLSAQKCANTFASIELDNWPYTEEVWGSGCAYRQGRERSLPYLEPSFWSPAVRALHAQSKAQVALGGDFVALANMGPGHVSVVLAKVVPGQAPDTNLRLTADEARPLIEDAALNAPALSLLYTFLDDPELGSGEEVLGCLVAHSSAAGDVLAIDPACP
jgi:hypothetical protein